MSQCLRLGYVPLNDALPLLAAQHLGHFLDHGLKVKLHPMASWAQLRDALLLGDLDAAHCLAGIPVASQAGLFGPQADLACAMTLNHYGNAITLARPLVESLGGVARVNAALPELVIAARERGRPLTLASVFPVSKHEFELRHWLRQMQLDPDRDLRLVVIPPPLAATALRERQIDGFCVGEPWNSLAVHQGLGEIVATSRELGLPGTEKVLATRSGWLEQAEHLALIRCLTETCAWLDEPAHRREALPGLAQALSLKASDLAPGLLGDVLGSDAAASPFIQFSGINRPDDWHAGWLLAQMQINHLLSRNGDSDAICERAFRADVFDQACVDERRIGAR